MNLTELRSRVRLDLRDTDPTAQRWPDAALDRHIQRALRELSLAIPDEAAAQLTTTPGSRDLSLAGLDGLIGVDAVEYPVDRYPPAYVPFSRRGSTLTLLVETAPQAAEPVRVLYARLHSLDAAGSTVPPQLEELLAAGAAAYAALEQAAYAVNRVNAGGPDVWRQFQAWGNERLAAFTRGLARYGRRNAVRVRRLYLPAGPER
ncbi:MAG TPA: hypothetical protein VIO14_06250 [Dehalococcoidia bacterium]